MLITYKAKLRGDLIEWIGERPANLDQSIAISVHITILEEAAQDLEQKISHGQKMAAILENIAALGGISSIPDPAIWERTIRQDRELTGRNE